VIPVEKFDPIFLSAFVRGLEQKGFDISTDDRILISELLIKFYNGEIKSLHELKIKIGALLCQTDEEQKTYYAAFDLEIEHLGELFKYKKTPVADVIIKTIWKKVFLVIGILALYITILLWIKETNTHYQKFASTEFNHQAQFEKLDFDLGIGNTGGRRKDVWYKEIFHFLTLEAFLIHTKFFGDKNVFMHWNLGDGSEHDTIPYNYSYKDTGTKIITIHYQTPEEDTIQRDTIYVCDPSPHIHPSSSPYFVGLPVTFMDTLSPEKEIIWSIDDGREFIRTKNKPLIYTFKTSGTHNVTAKYVGQSCDHTTLFYKREFEVEERNVYWIQAEELPPVNTQESKKRLRPFFWIILSAILLIVILLWLLYFFWDKISKWKVIKKYFDNEYITASDRQEIEADLDSLLQGGDPPFELEFPNQNKHIRNDEQLKSFISKLKFYNYSDRLKLNIDKTIRDSIQQRGQLNLSYEQLKFKKSFFILIEDSYKETIQTQLFQYLISRMLESQLNVDVYYYFDNPTEVYSTYPEASIPLSQIQDQYFNSACILIGNGFTFLDKNQAGIHPQYREIFSFWESRILITPIPSNDWSINENILKRFFHILPADMVGLLDTINLVRNTDYNSSFDPKKYLSYSLKYLVLEDIKVLKDYLNDPILFEWISSLAVYPRMTWELILCTGRIIEELHHTQILTYENLLKIIRISWIQQEEFPTRLRLDLLKSIPIETELAVREGLIHLLENTPSALSEMAAQEKVRELITNKFILYSNQPSKYPQYEEAQKQFLILYLNSLRSYEEKQTLPRNEISDTALKVYLNQKDPDYPANSNKDIEKKSWNTPLNLKDKSISLENYVDAKLAKPNYLEKIKYWLNIFKWFITIGLTSFLLYTLYIDKQEISSKLFTEYLSSKERRISFEFVQDKCFEFFNPSSFVLTDMDDKVLTASSIPKIDFSVLEDNYKLKIRNEKKEEIVYEIEPKHYKLKIQSMNCGLEKPKDKPLVYLQYFPVMYKDSAKIFQVILSNEGYVAPGVEYRENFNVSEVRYFSADMRDEAEKLAVKASQFYNKKILSVKLDNFKVRLNQIELWISKPLTIQYYSNAVDAKKIVKASSGMGNQYKLVANKNPLSEQTNVLYYSQPSLKPKAIILAKKLTERGVPLRKIEFQDNSKHLVKTDFQVGFSIGYMSEPLLDESKNRTNNIIKSKESNSNFATSNNLNLREGEPMGVSNVPVKNIGDTEEPYYMNKLVKDVNTYYNSRNFKEAIPLFEKLIIDPKSKNAPENTYKLAYCHNQLGNYKKSNLVLANNSLFFKKDKYWTAMFALLTADNYVKLKDNSNAKKVLENLMSMDSYILDLVDKNNEHLDYKELYNKVKKGESNPKN
jgi:hypothetical protein